MSGASETRPVAVAAWFARHRRRWPQGVAARMGLILLLCLFIGQAVSIGVYMWNRADDAVRVFAHSSARRAVAIVELLESRPVAERAKLIEAVNSPTLWLFLDQRRPRWLEGGWQNVTHHDEYVERFLGGLGERPFEMFVSDHWRRGTSSHSVPVPGAPDLFPSRQKYALLMPLADGQWLTFVAASDLTSLRWAGQMGLWVLLTGTAILVFGVWAAHRVTRPLRRFTEAADRLGLDVNAPPLPETGSREIREASHAFNRMQARLKRFVDDRTTMLAAISHDLKTALTRLRLRTEFIEDAEQQAKALGDLDEMQTMLDATLSFAREETSAEPKTRLDLGILVQSLVDDFADGGRAVSYRGAEKYSFEARPVALRRALSNLIDNAVKYGGAAEVELSDQGERVEIRIADRGPGIPVELREQAFAPFFRVEPSRSRETGGSGLGLAVARAVARGHGGDVAFDDRPGGGLIARLILPKPAKPT